MHHSGISHRHECIIPLQRRLAATGTFPYALCQSICITPDLGLTSFRTEWQIWGTEEWLAGSVDFVAINESGELHIFDWKRSRNLPRPQTVSL
jgi:hypothetical protein